MTVSVKMVLLWIASRQDNITNTPMKILSLPYPECKWLLIPDNFFSQCCISLILSTSYPLQMKCLGKLSRSLGDFFFSSFWTTGKKQKIAALHSLNIYFHQVISSSVFIANLQLSLASVVHVEGQNSSSRGNIPSQVGEKHRLRSYHFVP